MGKLPAFMFYPGDWMKDPELRSVSSGARGLWIDMLSLMFESARRGYLQFNNGKAVTAEYLARMTGNSTDDASRWLQELEYSGVLSRTDDGTIYNRRQIRDESERQKNRDRQERWQKRLRAKSVTNGGYNASITPSITALSVNEDVTVIDQKQKIPLRFDSTEVAQSLCSAEGLSGPVVIQALRETIEFVANRKKSEDYTEIGSQILGAWDAHQREKGKFAGSLLGFLGGGAYKPYLSEETTVVPARYASLQTVIAEAKRDLGKA